MTTIGARLKEERERLGLNQPAMGEVGGVKKLAQLKYEQNESSPSGIYFTAIARIGADVQYIVTGLRSQSQLSSDEVTLALKYRGLTKGQKEAVLLVIGEFAAISKRDEKAALSMDGVTGLHQQNDAGSKQRGNATEV